MTRRRAAALATAAALVLSACSVDPKIEFADNVDRTEPTPTAPTADPTPESTPGAPTTPTPGGSAATRPVPGEPATATTLVELGDFEQIDCGDFGVDDTVPGPPPRCGTLTVPEVWEDASATSSVRIPVVVFDATGDATGDPVVYLEGGPGGHAVETIAFGYETLVEPYRDNHDVVIYDQRGAGLSTPSLQCPEVLDLALDVLDDDLDDDELSDLEEEAEVACRDRLLDDGVDLSAYHSVASAHDLEALRLALGADTWNVLGISYGTRLGQTYVRMYPDGVRALVLDSIVPVAADLPAAFAPNAERAFEELFTSCEALPDCSEAYPDLRTRYFDLVDDLDADPIAVDATDNLTGQVYENALVDGDSLLSITFGALYSPTLFAAIPQLVDELEDRTTDLLADYVSIDVTNLPFASVGMLASVECHEEVSFSDPADLEAAVPDDRYYARFADFGNARPFFETCDRWPAGSAPAVENQPVTSDVPTLLLAGRLDPITPPSAIDAVVTGLTRSFAVVFEWEGHAPAGDLCGASIVRAFFDDPSAEPPAGCADDGPPAFVRRPVGDLTLEPVEVSGAGFAPLRSLAPAEWTGQGLGVWARSDSLADPTLLAQFAFPFPVDPGATVEVLLDSFGVEADVVEDEELAPREGVTYRRWRATEGSTTWDVAISDRIVIAVAAHSDEIDAVVDELTDVYESARIG